MNVYSKSCIEIKEHWIQAYFILRDSWYNPVPAIATFTLKRFQFFCMEFQRIKITHILIKSWEKHQI